MINIPYNVREAILAAITVPATGPLAFAGLKVGLYNSPLSINTKTTRAEIMAVEATFHGYTAGGNAPTGWGTTYRDGADNVYKDLQPMEVWVATDNVVSETIYGAFLDTGTEVIVEPFAAPVAIAQAGDSVHYLFTFPYGQ